MGPAGPWCSAHRSPTLECSRFHWCLGRWPLRCRRPGVQAGRRARPAFLLEPSPEPQEEPAKQQAQRLAREGRSPCYYYPTLQLRVPVRPKLQSRVAGLAKWQGWPGWTRAEGSEAEHQPMHSAGPGLTAPPEGSPGPADPRPPRNPRAIGCSFVCFLKRQTPRQ